MDVVGVAIGAQPTPGRMAEVPVRVNARYSISPTSTGAAQ